MTQTHNELLLNRLTQMQRDPRHAHDNEELALAVSTILKLESALAQAEEALESCIYTRECEDMTEEEWCPSCGDILAATNMKRERRIYSHADGCRLESALAAIKETHHD